METTEPLIPKLLLGILPAIIALAALYASLRVLRRWPRTPNLLATGFVFASVGSSLLILFRIFFLKASPTYLPHVAIGLALLVAILQMLALRWQRG